MYSYSLMSDCLSVCLALSLSRSALFLYLCLKHYTVNTTFHRTSMDTACFLLLYGFFSDSFYYSNTKLFLEIT